MTRRVASGAIFALVLGLLVGCGGGGAGPGDGVGSSSGSSGSSSSSGGASSGSGSSGGASSSGSGSTSSGGTSGGTPSLPPPGKAEASRFLARASFGATTASIDELTTQGYVAWIDRQMALPASLHLPRVQTLGGPAERAPRVDVWFTLALRGDDQLRQRVALALSEIFVVSDQTNQLASMQYGLANYQDILVRNAFGDYRQLLQEVTLSPVMGRWLSMLGNQKADPAKGIRADENFAREIMQLFSIGLVQLNPDGSERRDPDGRPIPTYSQADIENLARVFTGWTFSGSSAFDRPRANWIDPMMPFDDFHDRGAKTLVGDVRIAAGGSARSDLRVALDTLAAHPNVGPFIGYRLIQHLVTSNPSPAYVGRVAAAFNDNGRGQRGDLGAVVRAVLLDPEALPGAIAPPTFGKVREPLLQVARLWRAFDARADNGRYLFSQSQNTSEGIGQAPLSAPSVFNFFMPMYAPPGLLRASGLRAPEFQIVTESTTALLANFFDQSVFRGYRGVSSAKPETILIDISTEKMLAAGDLPALLDRLDLLLMGGRMPDAMRQSLLAHLAAIPAGDGTQRALEAIWLLMVSPQSLLQQ